MKESKSNGMPAAIRGLRPKERMKDSGPHPDVPLTVPAAHGECEVPRTTSFSLRTAFPDSVWGILQPSHDWSRRVVAHRLRSRSSRVGMK